MIISSLLCRHLNGNFHCIKLFWYRWDGILQKLQELFFAWCLQIHVFQGVSLGGLTNVYIMKKSKTGYRVITYKDRMTKLIHARSPPHSKIPERRS